MIKTPMQPIIHSQVTDILCRHFEASPEQAAVLATKIIKTLRQYDLDIVQGNWMELPTQEGPLTWETVTHRAEELARKQERPQRKPMTWEGLASRADELLQSRNGIRPWLPPELQ